MASGFDVMVSSISALNATLRQVGQDIRRNFDAQARYTPGDAADPYRQARDNISGQGHTTFQQTQGMASRRYNPTAGGTSQGNIGTSLGRVAQAFGAQTMSQAMGRGQTQGPPQTGPQAPPGGLPPFNPTTGYTLGLQYGLAQPPGSPQGPPQQPQGGGGGYGGPGGGFGGRGGGGSHGGHGGGNLMPGHGAGGGWTNMGVSAARRIPYVGTAMTIATETGNIYQSEREKNRLYQGMEGGTNAENFGERLHEETYRWGMGMGMSGDMARRSFKGVTALGYTGKSQTGQGRQDALDFVYHNYNARGMDPEESMGMLQTASRDATVNFTNLSNALKEVSDTAGKAGVNARLMRQQFQGMLDTAINTGSGPGSAALASTFSTTQASYGREFQNSNMQGQLSRGYQYMVGAQYGVNPGQLQGLMRNKPGEYARMVSGSQRNWIDTVFSSQQKSDLQALIKKYGTSQSAVPAIEQDFLNSHPEIDLNVIADTLSGPLTGVELDNSNVMDWVIQQLSGNTAAAHTPQSDPTKPIAIKDLDNKTGANKEGVSFGKYGLNPGTKVPVGTKGLNADIGLDKLQKINTGRRFGLFGAYDNNAGKDYVSRAKKSGQRDPVLEALLQNVDDPNNVKVKVATASGERVVSFAEAMKLFPNEMAAGKVTIVSGKDAGKTTSDIVGGNVDTTRDYKSELTGKEGQTAGQSAAEYEKKHPTKKGGDAVPQRVTIDLTTEAKRLLSVLPSVNSESGATGYPPANPYPSQASRP